MRQEKITEATWVEMGGAKIKRPYSPGCYRLEIKPKNKPSVALVITVHRLNQAQVNVIEYAIIQAWKNRHRGVIKTNLGWKVLEHEQISRFDWNIDPELILDVLEGALKGQDEPLLRLMESLGLGGGPKCIRKETGGTTSVTT